MLTCSSVRKQSSFLRKKLLSCDVARYVFWLPRQARDKHSGTIEEKRDTCVSAAGADGSRSAVRKAVGVDFEPQETLLLPEGGQGACEQTDRTKQRRHREKSFCPSFLVDLLAFSCTNEPFSFLERTTPREVSLSFFPFLIDCVSWEYE